MTRPSGTKSYLAPYVDAQEQFGSGFDVTLWASRQTQELRFEVFRQMCFFAGKRVLDAGCSRGDFAAFLQKHDIPYGQYIGVDGLPDVVEYARGRGLERASFHVGDFVADPAALTIGDPQIVVISGTLNTMEDDMAMRVLEAAWAAAGETLIFNFLSDRVGDRAIPQKYPARRFDTLRMVRWALEKTWAVQFRQDYFEQGHDATIMMQKRG